MYKGRRPKLWPRIILPLETAQLTRASAPVNVNVPREAEEASALHVLQNLAILTFCGVPLSVLWLENLDRQIRDPSLPSWSFLKKN